MFFVILIDLLVVCVIMYSIYLLINYICMMLLKPSHLLYDYADFNTFMNCFNKLSEDPRNFIEIEHDKIYFSKDGRRFYNCYNSATRFSLCEIRIEDKIMLLYPWSYVQYYFWFKNYIRKEKNTRRKGLFNEE